MIDSKSLLVVVGEVEVGRRHHVVCQVTVVGRAQTSDGIPANSGAERIRAAAFLLWLVGGDVIERLGLRRPSSIECRIDVAKSWLVLRNATTPATPATVSSMSCDAHNTASKHHHEMRPVQCIPQRVDHRKHGSNGWRRSRGSGNRHHDAVHKDLEVGRHGRDVRECTTGCVVERRWRSARQRHPLLNRSGLVRRLAKVVREATGRERNTDLVGSTRDGGATGRRDIRAGRWKVRREGGAVLWIFAANTPIARASDERDATHSVLHELVVDTGGITERHRVLEVLVADREQVGNCTPIHCASNDMSTLAQQPRYATQPYRW
jgi:hypothetical protein